MRLSHKYRTRNAMSIGAPLGFFAGSVTLCVLSFEKSISKPPLEGGRVLLAAFSCSVAGTRAGKDEREFHCDVELRELVLIAGGTHSFPSVADKLFRA